MIRTITAITLGVVIALVAVYAIGAFVTWQLDWPRVLDAGQRAGVSMVVMIFGICTAVLLNV